MKFEDTIADKKDTGEKLTKILREINDQLWDFESDYPGSRMGWSDQSLNYATKIFITIFLDRIWEYSLAIGQDHESIKRDAKRAGSSLRSLIKELTGLDMKKLIEEDLNGR